MATITQNPRQIFERARAYEVRQIEATRLSDDELQAASERLKSDAYPYTQGGRDLLGVLAEYEKRIEQAHAKKR